MISIPAVDLPAYELLPRLVRQEVNRWLMIVNQVEPLATKVGTAVAFEQIGRETGVRGGMVKIKYYAARKNGWRGLINWQRVGGWNHHTLPSEFLVYWRNLVLLHKHNAARAYRQFVEQYHSGKIIPGMPEPSERRRKLPCGTSLNSLRRHLPPSPWRILADSTASHAEASELCAAIIKAAISFSDTRTHGAKDARSSAGAAS